MAKRRHHRRRRSLSNPFSTSALTAPVKEMVSSHFIIEAASIGAGFVLPGVVMNYVPATWRASKLQFYAVKIGSVALLSVAASMVSKKIAKYILVGGGVSLLLDAWTEWMGSTAAPAAPAAGTVAPSTSAYYGGSISAYYGGDGSGMGDFDIP